MLAILTFVLAMTTGGQTMTPLGAMVNRNVLVSTDVSSCSGIILSTGLVLTVFHALDAGYGIKVNEKEATIIYVNPELDVMLLRAETAEVEQITFAFNIGVGESVIQIGNPQKKIGVVSTGRVVFREGNFVVSDTLAMRGFSGGGLYNLKGELVGIVQRMVGGENGSWVAISLSSEAFVLGLGSKQ